MEDKNDKDFFDKLDKLFGRSSEKVGENNGLQKSDIVTLDGTGSIVGSGVGEIISGTRSLYDAFYGMVDDVKSKETLTYNERMNTLKFSMEDIENLFAVLSLGLGDSTDRKALDTMFTNWKNDQLAKIK